MHRDRPQVWREASALVAGLILPLGMFVFSRSAPVLLGLAALLALAGVVQEGRLAELKGLVPQAWKNGWVRALAALVLYLGVSLAWTHALRPGLFAFGELLAAVAGATLLAACWAVSAPRMVARWLLVGLGLCAMLTVADLASHMAFRRHLGLRADTFVLNRTVVCALLLLWPALALVSRRYAWAMAAVVFGVAAAILRSDSGAALLGLCTGALAYLAGRLAPRLTIVGLATGTLLLLAAAPGIGPILDRALPASMHEALHTMHARDRIDIWRSYGEAVWQRPVFGSGFNASSRMAEDPVALQIPEPHRVLLGAGHPHNAPLQVWVEAGLAGAALLAWLILAVGRAAMRHPRPEVCALAASVVSIAAISHGAWQGWWIAAVGLSMVLMAQANGEDAEHG